MLSSNFVVFFLNVYLVSCAPTEEKKDLPVDQIAQDSNIGGVSETKKNEANYFFKIKISFSL